MTEDEAKTYLESRASEEDKSLRSFSDQALKIALAALTRAVKEKNRRVSRHDHEEDGSSSMWKDAVIDVDAAKALLKAGMDARKLLKRGSAVLGGGEPAGQRDLFDRANPWSFKKTD